MPCTYATETYNEVLRWLDNTPIKYAANPKLKGSKSFVRYAKYSKAKTVGEALRFGSYYLDLLFDHEHGHLKATGQPKRKELVSPNKADWDDSWNATDKILSKMHAKWITWSKTFEVADRLGVDRRNLTSNKMGGISVEMHAQRMEAHMMAKLILEEADKRGRPVTDADLLHVLRLWEFKQNTTRQNVMKEGIEWVNSDTLGLLAGYDGTVSVNGATRHYPAVPSLMTRWLQDHLPKDCGLRDSGFKFSSINVNRGYAAKLHRDGNNEGPSFIAAFGDFTGGELCYWPEDDKTKAPIDKLRKEDAKELDLKSNLVMFDGNRGHAVNDFQGERYTIVYFTIGRANRVSAQGREQLAAVGIQVPDAEALAAEKAMLSPPLGYGEHASKPPPGVRHPLRRWARSKKEKPIVDDLTEAQIQQAKQAAKEVEPPAEDEDLPPETVFVGQQFVRKTNEEGLKVCRVFLKGASGRMVLAVEGVEEKKGTARYQYKRVPTFTLGKALDSHRLSEVRSWIDKVIKATGGDKVAKAGKKQRGPAAGEAKVAGAKAKAKGSLRVRVSLKKKAGKAVAAKKAEAEPEQATPPRPPRKRAASVTPTAKAEQPSAKQPRTSKGGTAKASPGKKGPALSKKEALELLSRCTEGTAVVYQPDGKTAESHKGSYQRYQAYAKAASFKEALELGASAADILYDVQAGFLKIKGSRKGPAAPADSRFGKLVGKWAEQLKAL